MMIRQTGRARSVAWLVATLGLIGCGTEAVDPYDGPVTDEAYIQIMTDLMLLDARPRGGASSAEPEALAEVPPADRQIRVWYRRGGGSNGNVTAGLLTTLKDPIPGVEVIRIWGDERPPVARAWLTMPEDEVRERFYAISAERRIVPPAVAAITEAARSQLFPNGDR